MQLNEVLKELDGLLQRDWGRAKPDAKVQVIKILKACEPMLGPEAMTSWAKRVAYAWNLPLPTLQVVLDNPAKVELLNHTEPKPRAPEEHPFPKTGWIGDYLRYTLNSEAPYIFHFWVAVGIIGGITGRNVFFDKGHYRVYPNHFIILVSPSGVCRKSSAISIGIRFLRTLEHINVLAEKITPEALVEALMSKKRLVGGVEIQSECSGFIHAPELAVFLGKQMYNEGLIALLTGLSDNPDKWEYRTRTKKTVHLLNVNLSLLGASTPDWLYDCIPQTAFGGGFMSRIIFVVQNTTPRSLPFPLPPDPTLQGLLEERFAELSKTSGEFVNTQDGKEWYEAWYHQLGEDKKKVDDPRLCGYFERKPDHLIRLAMILTLAYGRPALLAGDIYQEALKILNKLEAPMPDAFVHAGETIVGANSRRVLKYLSTAGPKGATRSVLLKKGHRYYDKVGLTKILDTLQAADMIDNVSVGGREIWVLRNEKD